jgi:hypothetical protein
MRNRLLPYNEFYECILFEAELIPIIDGPCSLLPNPSFAPWVNDLFPIYSWAGSGIQ